VKLPTPPLPDPPELEATCLSLAVLDAVLGPQWQYRTHSFDASWSAGARMASQRDGSGDDVFVVFEDAGVYVQGLAHESAMAPPSEGRPASAEMFAGLPPAMLCWLDEPAFGPRCCSFCLYWDVRSPGWHRCLDEGRDGADVDGSAALLGIYAGGVQAYREYAQDYFEVQLAESSVRSIYEQRALTDELIRALNPEADVRAARREASEMGYPG